MSFSYSINNGSIIGTCETKSEWNTIRNNNKSTMTQCTLSGTAPSDMSQMFQSCSALTSVDLSNLDTSNVTSMRSMFYNCETLTSLDLSNFNTSNVTDMGTMFQSCSALTSLDVSSFNTSNVNNMYSMFNDCRALTDLNLLNFDTSNVTSMSYMFGGCQALTDLNLSSFNTSSVTSISAMFYNCFYLKHIYVSNTFVTTNIASSGSMFEYCASLPNYNSSVIDKTNAHTGTGGYLTDIGELIKTAEIYYKYNSNVFKLKAGENFPIIEVTATGSYIPSASSNSNYGACINKDGYLVIYAYSYSTAYEHYYFVNTSIPASFGVIADGWNITSWDTSDNATHLEACTIKGIDVSKYSKIKVALNFTSVNSSYDYVQCNVTITTE